MRLFYNKSKRYISITKKITSWKQCKNITYGEIFLKHGFELDVANNFMNYKLPPVSNFHPFSYRLASFSVIYYIKVDIQYQIPCLAHVV